MKAMRASAQGQSTTDACEAAFRGSFSAVVQPFGPAAVWIPENQHSLNDEEIETHEVVVFCAGGSGLWSDLRDHTGSRL